MFWTHVSGAREMSERLKALPDKLRAALAEKCASLADDLRIHIQDDELNGQKLQIRTGALRDSIQTDVRFEGGAPIASVYSQGVKYAMAQEAGFQGAESVSSYVRDIRQAFGRAIDLKSVVVHAFSRDMNLPAHDFMKDGLADRRDDIEAALLSVVKEGLMT